MKTALRRRWDNLSSVEKVILGYNVLLLALIFCAPHSVPQKQLWLVFHTSVILVQLSVASRESDTGSAAFVFIRHWWPVLFLIPIYSEATLLDQSFVQGFHDSLLQRWERSLWGSEPAAWLAKGAPTFWIQFLHLVYFSYYLLMIFPGWLLYRRDHNAFRAYLTGLLVLFMVHDLWFILFPALGPLDQRAGLFTGFGGFVGLMNFIYSWGEYGGGAFPSSHVAASWFIFLTLRKLFRWRGQLIFGLWVGLIAFSTVFCAYHYGVDVMGGIISGSLGYLIYYRATLARNIGFVAVPGLEN